MIEKEAGRVAVALERVALLLGAQHATNLGNADLATKADVLARFGFSHREIAIMLNSTERSVTVSISTRKKKARRKQ